MANIWALALLCSALSLQINAESTPSPILKLHPGPWNTPPLTSDHANIADIPFNTSVTLDLDVKHPIAPTLFGIFFEEIGHAGEGGLYAELVQDRSFDATAAAAGFSTPQENMPLRMTVDLEELSNSHPDPTKPISYPEFPQQTSGSFSKQERLAQILGQTADNSAKDPLKAIIVPWVALAGTSAVLTRELPLNPGNQVAMELTVSGPPSASSFEKSSSAPEGGIMNYGYWGIALEKDTPYEFSVFIRNPGSEDIDVTVALTGADLATQHAQHTFTVSAAGGKWKQYSSTLVTSGTDTDARLVLSFTGPATLIIDGVSLFPAENVEKAKALGHQNPWPFRQDLLQALKALRPAFMRFPGGCYVEGDWMRNSFKWKNSIGSMHARPGHYNLWGYWSTDGLGLFEYMTLAEELDTEPIWVINNGVAHGDSVPTTAALPLLQDALDSIEFITGSSDSTWGSLRAAMGRKEPWKLNYMAIGNEDCGKPYYLENYNLFFGALHAAYPHLRLISNCDMGDAAPTDLWDWHVYTSPQSMFDLRKAFDGRDPAAGHFVFASEYAVTDGGGWGNLIGAVAEAAFMTGLERNGQAVQMGAYAPLFVHWNDRPWPTNMIVINNHQWFGIPSYHVQRMFRETQGTDYISTNVVQPPGAEGVSETVAASASCQDHDCTAVALKLVNFAPVSQRIAVSVRKGAAAAAVLSEAEALVLSSERPEDENSFEEPLKVAPQGLPLDGASDAFILEVAPWSLSVIQLHLGTAPSEKIELSKSADSSAAFV